jgi:hypothetical protein
VSRIAPLDIPERVMRQLVAHRLALAVTLALFVPVLAAAPAGATSILIDQFAKTPPPSGLHVQVTPGSNDDFTVTNPQSNGRGEVITSMHVDVGPIEGTEGFSASGPPTRTDGSTTPGPNGTCAPDPPPNIVLDGSDVSTYATCDLADDTAATSTGAILPGESQTFSFAPAFPRSPFLNNPRNWVMYFNFNFSNLPASCRPTIASAFTSAFAGTIADNCTTPTHTTITKAKINRKRRTASFQLKAKGATGFFCQLVRNGKVMFHKSCTHQKTYASPLPAGSYGFTAAGVNHVGEDQNPASYAFTIKKG